MAREEFDLKKEKAIEDIFRNIKRIFHHVTGEEIEFSLMEDLAEPEKIQDFEGYLKECNVVMPRMVKFLVNMAYEQKVKEALNKKSDAIVHLYMT